MHTALGLLSHWRQSLPHCKHTSQTPLGPHSHTACNFAINLTGVLDFKTTGWEAGHGLLLDAGARLYENQ